MNRFFVSECPNVDLYKVMIVQLPGNFYFHCIWNEMEVATVYKAKNEDNPNCEKSKQDSNALHFHHFYCIHCAIPIHKPFFERMHEREVTLLLIIRKNLYCL